MRERRYIDLGVDIAARVGRDSQARHVAVRRLGVVLNRVHGADTD